MSIRPFLLRAFRVAGRRENQPGKAVAEIEKIIENAHVRRRYFKPKRSHIRAIARKLNIAYIEILRHANRARRALKEEQVRPPPRKGELRKIERNYG